MAKNVKLYLSSRELWFTIIFLKQYSRQKGTNSTQRDNYGISALYNSFPEKIREIHRTTDTCDKTIFLNPKLPLKKPLWWWFVVNFMKHLRQTFFKKHLSDTQFNEFTSTASLFWHCKSFCNESTFFKHVNFSDSLSVVVLYICSINWLF